MAKTEKDMEMRYLRNIIPSEFQIKKNIYIYIVNRQTVHIYWRPSIKDVRSQESSADIFWTREEGDFLARKNIGFFEIYGVSAQTRGEGG